MKKVLFLFSIVFVFAGCKKENDQTALGCDLQKVYADNALKVTITNGITGTVLFTEGDCMPMVPPNTSSCRTCPVKRKLKIYDYTLPNQAVKISASFYESFSTQLIKEVEADENGFFQVDIPQGKYSVMVVEDGKLYACFSDNQGGIGEIDFAGGVQKITVPIIYKATF